MDLLQTGKILFSSAGASLIDRDRFGRRLVLALCCVGTICSLLWILLICYADTNLPIKLVWASSIFLFIGGSQRVAKGMNFTVIADTVDKSHRSVRTVCWLV